MAKKKVVKAAKNMPKKRKNNNSNSKWKLAGRKISDKMKKNKSLPATKIKKTKHNLPATKLKTCKGDNFKKNGKEASHLSNKFVNRKCLSLRERMMHVMKSAKFRYTNEQLYTANSKTIKNCFENLEDFKSYHEGFGQQVKEWPLNPLDVLINSLKRSMNDGESVADLGCGEGRLAQSLPHLLVHSFDLVALKPWVTAADMAHLPLPPASINAVVFCLSLMAPDVSNYITEANRILVNNGILKIAEVESRFENVEKFIDSVKKHGFTLVSKNLTHNFFLFFDFKKVSNSGKSPPKVILSPCTYKKR